MRRAILPKGIFLGFHRVETLESADGLIHLLFVALVRPVFNVTTEAFPFPLPKTVG